MPASTTETITQIIFRLAVAAGRHDLFTHRIIDGNEGVIYAFGLGFATDSPTADNPDTFTVVLKKDGSADTATFRFNRLRDGSYAHTYGWNAPTTPENVDTLIRVSEDFLALP